MARKLDDAQVDDLVLKYRAGASGDDLAREFGVSPAFVLKLLRERGEPRRTLSEAARLRAANGKFNRRIQLEDDAVVAGFMSGKSVKALSVEHHCSRDAIGRVLRLAGIEPRGRSEANVLRLAQAGPDGRAAVVARAHEAVRGMKRSMDEKVASARTRQEKRLHTSPAEHALVAMLRERGIEGVMQEAIGPYNCDIGAAPVAVEIFGGDWHWSGRHLLRTPERFRYILDAGWHILVVKVTKSFPLTAATADYVAAFVEQARRDPATRREYRVIRGAGELLAAGSADDDEITIVPALKRGRDALGRYAGVPR